MHKNTMTIGRLFGIPIRIHVSWFLIFALVTWSLAQGYFPDRYPAWTTELTWGIALATTLLFFVSVLLHELAHSLVARARGLPINDIVLFIFGGVSELTEEPEKPRIEFQMAIVGPLTSFFLAAVFFFIWLIARTRNLPLAALSIYLAGINASLGAFNLIPGFPLDGGRVLRAALWSASKSLEKATRWATTVGQIVAYLFIGLGVLQVLQRQWINGIWLAFIGWFLENAAQTSYRQVAIKQFLIRHRVDEAMNKQCYPLSPDTTLERLVRNYILPLGLRCFPVVEQGEIQGLVSLPLVRKVPESNWNQVTARAVMYPLDQVSAVSPNDHLWDALSKMTAEGVEQFPVISDGELAGVLTHDNVIRFLREHSRVEV
jgi:Zn-dependent protease